MFGVRKTACPTCIYRGDNPLDLQSLEDAVKDEHGFFEGHRICHHSENLCCRGFWNRHKDEFPLGQVAQRMGMVRYSDDG